MSAASTSKSAGENTRLHVELDKGSGIEIIKSLIAEGADVNTKNRLDESVLYFAVKRGKDLSMIKTLISAGGDINCKARGNTLLHEVQSVEVARELLSHGLNVNAANRFRDTALHIAIKSGKGKDIIDVLLAAGGNVNAKNKRKETVLYSAVKSGRELAIIKSLISAGGDINYKIKGNTLLHEVLSLEVARELLSLGLDINALNDYGESPLHHVFLNAPDECTTTMVKEFLKRGAVVDKSDSVELNPINAVSELWLGEKDSRRYNHSRTSTYDELDTFLDASVDYKYKELVWILVSHGADIKSAVISSLYVVLDDWDVQWAKFLIKVALMKNAFDDINEIINSNSSQSYFGHTELVKFLQDCAAEVQLMKGDMFSGNIPLFNFLNREGVIEKVYPLRPKCDDVMDEILTNYPVYSDFIYPMIKVSVERGNLLDKLKGLRIYVKKSELKDINLEYYILREIAEYLSNSDLANLLIV